VARMTCREQGWEYWRLDSALHLADQWQAEWRKAIAERDELARELRSRGYGWVVSRVLEQNGESE